MLMSAAGYGWLADLILLLHLAFVIFVVVGALPVMRWRWLAWLHLPAVAWAVFVEFSGRICPLTPLENHYRALAGEAGYAGGFVEHYIQPLLYPPGLTFAMQWLIGGFVLVLNLSLYGWMLRHHRPIFSCVAVILGNTGISDRKGASIHMASVHHGDCPEPRAWIRHPAGMAIDVRPGTALTDWQADAPPAEHGAEHLRDISLGGLACYSRLPHTCGEIVSITIHCTRPPFEVVARVVWCDALGCGYDLGVQFMHQDDAFAARMVEQICHIEQYRQDMLEHHGREIDSETAAREWIEKFAASFPDPRALH